MKKYLPVIFFSFLLLNQLGCKTSKEYLERSNEYKALQDAVKQLGKNNDDEKAKEAIPVLYKQVSENRLKQIADLNSSPDLSRYDKTIKLYTELEDLYQAIIITPAAFRLVNPASYSSQIFETREAAAEAYYISGKNELIKSDRSDIKKAYNYFTKADTYVPNYKDAKLLKGDAYNKAMIYVVINQVRDNAYFSNQTWNSGLSYSNEYFQRSLVRDLNSLNHNYYPSQFFTDWDARSKNINPEWTVDLLVQNIIMPYSPTDYRYRSNRSAQIEIGRDTSGNPSYKTVYATLNITRSTMIARADMDVVINNTATGQSIRRRTFRDEYRWQTERATYTGDSRALNPSDWDLINSGYHQPQRDYLLEELYKRIYPQVKNYLTTSVSW